MRARSTAASVCPARTSTPPERARSGNTCPGRARSRGVVAGSIATWIVRGAIRGRNAGRRAGLGVDRHADRRLARRRVVGDLERNLELVEPLRRHRQADEAAAVLRHEVDGLRRHLRRRHRQIAFVLAILVVDDDDHLAGADGRRSPSSIGANGAPCRARLWRASTSCHHVLQSSRRCRRLGHQPRDVLAEHVGLEIHGVARRCASTAPCAAHVNGTICTPTRRAVERRDRQADAVDRDRALVDQIAARAPPAPRRRASSSRRPARTTERGRRRRRGRARSDRRAGASARSGRSRLTTRPASHAPERRHAQRLRRHVAPKPGVARDVTVRQTPLTAMLSPRRSSAASGVAHVEHAARRRPASTRSIVPVPSISPVNIPLHQHVVAQSVRDARRRAGRGSRQSRRRRTPAPSTCGVRTRCTRSTRPRVEERRLQRRAAFDEQRRARSRAASRRSTAARSSAFERPRPRRPAGAGACDGVRPLVGRRLRATSHYDRPVGEGREHARRGRHADPPVEDHAQSAAARDRRAAP